MRVLLIAVGRSRDRAIAELVERYARRCPWPFETLEVQPRGRVDPHKLAAEEARLLLAAVPEGAAIIALDEHGELQDSQTFAHRLGALRDQGRRCIAFLIGGADGHAPELLARADLKLAFGRMTWPHEMVRVLLAEQVYRATTILSGHPYHRG
ncbi:23S rRNA (pseudouridine(1915)-N(3))-methyltransferase RlmH [Marinimicrococcus flavescens]|uniref:Ribosomal RNA large subunit methyltransferase H n=1 Tax=Marinimicrococcus flavescens TaxID=3031815 RepID=A0AAP3V1X1_9PROT|nr:23S rRNA (pseudouridine(1915)-N(3))-methyltransferase RlmH [Marinimicrococcus flavescens]